jgi:hypothetical protein
MESFATPWFLFAKPTNHYLVFYLLEIFNNVIQYQFDGKYEAGKSIHSYLGGAELYHWLVFYGTSNYPAMQWQSLPCSS